MTEKVTKVGIKREAGYLYFIDKRGDVSRARMLGKRLAVEPQKVFKVGIKKEMGYLYFLDKSGDISRARLGANQQTIAKSVLITPEVLEANVVNRLEKEQDRQRLADFRNRFVFISYSHKDSAIVSKTNKYLKSKGINTWFDKDKLKGGHHWETEIKRAIDQCILFVTFLSNNSVNSKGYFQSESKFSHAMWERVPEGRPYIIPVMIEPNVALPESLSRIHAIQYTTPYKMHSRLNEAINTQMERWVS